jgi:hypothetical protein
VGGLIFTVEGQRLRVFENRVQRTIFGPKDRDQLQAVVDIIMNLKVS